MKFDGIRLTNGVASFFQSGCVAVWGHAIKPDWIVVPSERCFGRLVTKVVKETQLKVVLLHPLGGLQTGDRLRGATPAIAETNFCARPPREAPNKLMPIRVLPARQYRMQSVIPFKTVWRRG